jgi:hypothetical protein
MLTSAPWLDINPLAVLQPAAEGARLGLDRSRLALSAQEATNQADEAAGRLGLAYAQLASENANRGANLVSGAAWRNAELNQNAVSQAQNQQRIDLQQKKLDAADELKRHIDNDSAGFMEDLTGGSSAADALKKNPLASHDPTVRSLVTQAEIAKRTASTQKAIGERSNDRLAQRYLHDSINGISSEIKNLEATLANQDYKENMDPKELDRMKNDLAQKKKRKTELEKEYSDAFGPLSETTPPISGVGVQSADDPLGILGGSQPVKSTD